MDIIWKNLRRLYENIKKDIEKLAEKQWDTKIPKIIHYMWVGNNPKSEEILNNIESWKKLNPDFEIIEWNENNFDLNFCQFIKDALSNKKYAFVADWVRLYAINKMGPTKKLRVSAVKKRKHPPNNHQL